MDKILKLMNWRTLILAVNLLLILDTGVFPYVHDGSLKWRLLVYLSLAGEMNIAVWWSSSLLLLSGLVSYHISSWDVDSKHAWVTMSFLFFFLSMDEIGSIHERVGNLSVGTVAYIVIAMIAGSALMYSIWVLWKNKSDKRGLLLLLLGIALLVTAAPNEYLEHHLDWPSYLTGPRTAFEAGLELLGAFVCLSSIARFDSVNEIRNLGLSSSEKKRTGNILIAGFVFHLGMAWISAHYIEIGFRGNPAVWYFMAVFMALAIFFLLKAANVAGANFIIYLLNFCYFTILSISSLFFILPNPSSTFDKLGLIANPNMILTFQLLLIFVLYLALVRKLTGREIILFLVVVCTLGLGWYAGDQFVIYMATGVFSLVTATLFISNTKALSN
jgi:hypothetical protein